MNKEYIRNTLIDCGLVIAFAIIYHATKQIPAPDSITLDVMLSLVNIGALVSSEYGVPAALGSAGDCCFGSTSTSHKRLISSTIHAQN